MIRRAPGVNGLDFATQLQEMKAIAGQSDFSLGSDYAITREEGSSLPWRPAASFLPTPDPKSVS
jgi:hypothetical protein